MTSRPLKPKPWYKNAIWLSGFSLHLNPSVESYGGTDFFLLLWTSLKINSIFPEDKKKQQLCNGSTDMSDGILAKGHVEGFRKYCVTAVCVCVCVGFSSWARMPLNLSMLCEL